MSKAQQNDSPIEHTGTEPKVVLVTGAARRIGRAICSALHHKGFNVIVHYGKSESDALQLANELNQQRPGSAHAIQANLNNFSEVLNLASQSQAVFGRMDALINNASSFYPTPIATADEAQWQDLMNTNLKAPYFLAQALYTHLKVQNGNIINIVDIYSERPMPNHSIYSMAKAANRMMVMSLAQEFAPEVRVNGVAPGAILWPEDEQGNPKQNPTKLAGIPLKRLGGTEPITQAVLYLLTGALYTTGQILAVDGGKSILL